MQGTVEAAMATEAQTGVSKFLDFTKKQCEALKAQRRLQQPAVPTPAQDAADAGAATPDQPEEKRQRRVAAAEAAPAGEELFFDALDEATAPLPAGEALGTLLGRPAAGAAAGLRVGGSAQEVLGLAALRELQVRPGVRG